MAETNRTAIEQRAHKIWISKGRRDGHSLEDWAQAEVELRAEAARASKPAGTASKPAGAAFGGNLASATVAAPKGGVVAGPKGAAFPAAGSAKSPAAGNAPTVASPSGTAPMKNGNRPPPKNGKGKKR